MGKTRARAGVAMTVCAMSIAAVAYGATSVSFRGKTSQRRSISLVVSGGYVQKLQYRIDDRCPKHKLLFVHDYGFPPIAIGQRGKFVGKFSARAPQEATAIIQGTVSRRRVTGSLSDRTKDSGTHKFCTGKATFKLTHH